MGRERVFSAFGFAKCFQVSFLHLATPFVVLAYAFAVFLEFVWTLFRSPNGLVLANSSIA